jgi:hypothetical protein
VKANEHDGEDEAFVQDRIDEWLIFKPLSKVEVLRDEQDFRENQRIDNRKSVLLVIQMTLC